MTLPFYFHEAPLRFFRRNRKRESRKINTNLCTQNAPVSALHKHKHIIVYSRVAGQYTMWITKHFEPITTGLYSHTLAQKASHRWGLSPCLLRREKGYSITPLIFDEIAAPASLAGLVKDTVFDHSYELSLESFFAARFE
jgi:hypothetical protein